MVAIALAAILAGCASAAAVHVGGEAPDAIVAAPAPTPIVAPSAPVDQAEFGTGDAATDMTLLSSEVVNGLLAVRDYAPTAHPDAYTDIGSGTRGDPDVLRIYLTELDPVVEADLLRVAGTPPEKVLFLQSVYSAAAAKPVAEKVTALSEDLRSEGIQLTSWGMDTDGYVDIFIEGHDPAQIDRLFTLFGPAVKFTTDTLPAVALDGGSAGAPAPAVP